MINDEIRGTTLSAALVGLVDEVASAAGNALAGELAST